MDFRRFDKAIDFQAAAAALLERRPAENSLMIGIVARLIEDGDAEPADSEKRPLLCVVEEAGRVACAAIRTPPHPLVVTQAPPQTLAFMAECLHAGGISLPGVNGPKPASEAFSAAWTRLSGQQAHVEMSLGAYQLDRVSTVPQVPGRLVQAAADDTELLVTWAQGFQQDVHTEPADVRPMVQKRLASGEIFLWINGQPVSMAASMLPTPVGMGVNLVYTPPPLRCRGYATAAVAALSQRLLDAGYKHCFLFTDLANPTSNSIYQKIGYRRVCDFQHYNFVAE